MATSSTTTSIGPAGKRYTSIEEAGKCMLKQYCDSFPSTHKSFMLPPLFVSEYRGSPNVQKPKVGLTVAEENKYQGLMINKTGEGAEKLVYYMFNSLIRQKHNSPMLILRHFSLDNDNSRKIRTNALISEMSAIDLRRANTRGEHDFIVLVKDLGAACVEVKASSFGNNIPKAEQQLNSAVEFVQSLMRAITGTTSANLPTAKLILLPDDAGMVTMMTKYGTRVVYKDVCSNFEKEWEGIIEELSQKKLTNSFSDGDFERFTNIMVGMWASKPIDARRFNKLDFNDTGASLTFLINQVDDEVDKGVISSEEKKNKNKKKKNISVTDIVSTEGIGLFQIAMEINLLYLTPFQKELYDNYIQAIIRGHAGTGKTLLILFKVIDIMKNPGHHQILLLAPHPHHLRCKSILLSNNINVEIITEFPTKSMSQNITDFLVSPPPPTPTQPSATNKVTIMELRDFFSVEKEKLMNYDLGGHHIFADDLQSFRKEDGRNNADYRDIGDFIEQTYIESKRRHLYAWFGLDVVQSGEFLDDDGTYAISLFYRKGGQKRSFSIPVVTLEQVLRNTVEVAKVVIEARGERISNGTPGTSSKVISNIDTGHEITSQIVHYHKLVQGTDEQHCEPFLCQRLCEELQLLTGRKYSLKLSGISILFYSNNGFNNWKETIENLLSTTLNIPTQTIEEHIVSRNCDAVVLDVLKNTTSYESPCVIYISTSGKYGIHYNLTSRARTRLTIIDIVTNYPPRPYNNVDLVLWKHDNNSFYKT